MHEFQVGTYRKATFGNGRLAIIAGPCVVESAEHVLFMAKACARSAEAAELDYVFKASYDKANRTSVTSFRGLGMKAGLDALRRVKEELGLPVLTDVHDVSQVEAAAEVADILQIPAFLSRQTDLIVAAVKTGRAVNIKKGQFLAPHDARNIVEKAKAAGGEKILITERGVTFGYNNLVVDMRSFPIMRKFDVPVIFDVTHSLQLPGGLGSTSGGEPEFIEPLARAAVACGVDGVFMETHDRPAEALSDGANALSLERFEPLLQMLKAVHTVINFPKSDL
ncbi:MAG: 3-deoxy-8-phosphooctulonate synthase [Pyrinomonadaceae bacterium]